MLGFTSWVKRAADVGLDCIVIGVSVTVALLEVYTHMRKKATGPTVHFFRPNSVLVPDSLL
jgi:hypothetical protein